MDPFALTPFAFFFVVAGVFALVIAVAVHQWQAKNRRREALATWALTRAMTFVPVDKSMPTRFDFALFERGDGRGCDNVASGTWEGFDVHVADYWFYEESSDSKGGRSRNYRRFSVVLLRIDAMVPHVRIERETAFSRLADHVGFRDIEFESEDFNRRFDVRADDRQFAFKLLDARFIEWLLAATHKHCYEVSGPWLLAYSEQLPVEQVPTLLSSAQAFVSHIPRLVWADYGKASS
ncbi:MAG TPA: DUF3137 domain-containing protein [Acidimicrobiales bacterium]|nr:DUF3137 domain-containing protein [Acidimicrobiales bacterium]